MPVLAGRLVEISFHKLREKNQFQIKRLWQKFARRSEQYTEKLRITVLGSLITQTFYIFELIITDLHRQNYHSFKGFGKKARKFVVILKENNVIIKVGFF